MRTIAPYISQSTQHLCLWQQHVDWAVMPSTTNNKQQTTNNKPGRCQSKTQNHIFNFWFNRKHGYVGHGYLGGAAQPTLIFKREYMRDEYDFSKGNRGGFYHPDAKTYLPLHLDKDVQSMLVSLATASGKDYAELANDLLRKVLITRDGQSHPKWCSQIRQVLKKTRNPTTGILCISKQGSLHSMQHHR